MPKLRIPVGLEEYVQAQPQREAKMSKLPYSPICNIPIEFLELHAISHSFCAGVQLSPNLYGSWLAASYPFLHCIYIDCPFVNSIFAQVIEYETPFLKFI